MAITEHLVALKFKADAASLKQAQQEAQRSATIGLGGTAALGAAGINQAVELLGKIVGFMSKSSPALEGTFKLFESAFLLFFKPFGDFLSTLLRPMAVRLIKMAIDFGKFMDTLTPAQIAGAIALAVGGVLLGGVFLAGLATAITGALGALGVAVAGGAVGGVSLLGAGLVGAGAALLFAFEDATKIGEEIRGLFDFLVEGLTGAADALNQALTDFIDDPAGFIATLIDNLFKFGTELGEGLRDSIDGLIEFMEEKAIPFLTKVGEDVLDIIIDTIKTGTSVLGDLGQDVLDLITTNITGGLSVLDDLGQNILDTVLGFITPEKPAAAVPFQGPVGSFQGYDVAGARVVVGEVNVATGPIANDFDIADIGLKIQDAIEKHLQIATGSTTSQGQNQVVS